MATVYKIEISATSPFVSYSESEIKNLIHELLKSEDIKSNNINVKITG